MATKDAPKSEISSEQVSKDAPKSEISSEQVSKDAPKSEISSEQVSKDAPKPEPKKTIPKYKVLLGPVKTPQGLKQNGEIFEMENESAAQRLIDAGIIAKSR